MKKLNIFLISLVLIFASANAQNKSQGALPQLKDGLKSCSPITAKAIANDQSTSGFKSSPVVKPDVPENTDVVSIETIGSSANAYGYGYGGGQKCLLSVNNDLNTVTNFHRMGGELDPGGYSGDMGYDISTDGGMTWTTMIEVYVASENAGGPYFIDAARYPNHGVYNPAGNTDPNNAYLSFFAPNLDETNGTWGGYSYGIHHIGSASNVDTTKHLLSSNPASNKYQYIPDGYAMVSANNEYWVGDFNQDWTSGALVYLNEMIISHGVWNSGQQDFILEQFILDCIMQPGASRPANLKIEFSPDGQTGYIAVLGDNGSVPISTDLSYYPILWSTTDAGATWSGPIAVALAGTNGIEDVQNYLSDDEIAELYLEPIPDRDEIPFTTAFDFDLSVDAFGNPHIAVICGVSVDVYSIGSGISPSSGYCYTCAFLLSSSDKGNAGSWIGYELGRPKSFRGNFGDLTEDNRIQIARNHSGTKMFVSWIDTHPDVSSENNAPDIWARGVDIIAYKLTSNEYGQDEPSNVTFYSEATFSAYFFAMGNEVFTNGSNYTIPYTYENMTPTDPAQPVQFKYIQDFMFNESDFTIPYNGNPPLGAPQNLAAQISGNTVTLTWTAPPSDAFLGYNVFRDGIKITPFIISATTYTNINVPEGLHEYYVTAVYNEGISGPSNIVSVFIQNTIPQNFEPIWTSPYNPMTFYVMQASIDGLNMQPGDEIGLFDVDPGTGNQICVGAGVLTEELTGDIYLELIASMDDGASPEVANGFTPGHTIFYKLWNEVLGEISNVATNYPYPGYDEVYTSQGSAFVELGGFNTLTQTIDLTQGWNIFSCRAVPDNMDMLNIVQPLIDDDVLVKVLDEAGGSIFHLPFPPPNGQWSNSIGDMMLTDGYYIKVNGAATFDVEGSPVETPLDIPLSIGWNIISYPCEYSQNALDAVQQLIDQDVLIKVIDESGGTIFHLPFPPPNGQWSNTIGNFESGEGYYVKVTQNTSLTIACPADFTEVLNPEPVKVETSFFQPVFENNPYMPMHIVIAPNDELQVGNEIGVFDGDVCVGATVYDGGQESLITVITSSDDPETSYAEGFLSGNKLEVRIADLQSGTVYETDFEVLEGTDYFEPLETAILNLQNVFVGESMQDLGGISMQIIPNPVEDVANIILHIKDNANAELQIQDLTGKIRSMKFYGNLTAGRHELTADISSYQSGIYFIRIKIFYGETSRLINGKLIKL